jgi:hypothetical protein
MKRVYSFQLCRSGRWVDVSNYWRACRKTLNMAIWALSMNYKSLIFKRVKNATIDQLAFFDRLSSLRKNSILAVNARSVSDAAIPKCLVLL